MANFTAGQTSGNEQAATELLRSQGISSPSSGLVRYVAYGAQDYSLNESRQYGLPVKQSDLIGEATAAREAAIAPAIATLEQGRPIIQSSYAEKGRQLEAEKTPTTQRYAALIDELTRRESRDVGAAVGALAREYGKRGISLSSGAYDVAKNQTTQPISEFYTGQNKDVTFEREDKLRQIGNLLAELPIQMSAELNKLDQTIANLRAEGANQALTDAYQSYRDEKEREYNDKLLELKKQEVQISSAPTYSAVTVGDSAYAFNPKTGQYIPTGISALKKQVGGDAISLKTTTKTTEPKPSTTSYSSQQIQAFKDFGYLPNSYQP